MSRSAASALSEAAPTPPSLAQAGAAQAAGARSPVVGALHRLVEGLQPSAARVAVGGAAAVRRAAQAKGVILRLKRRAVLESGDATLALKSCSHPSIVRD